MGLLLILLAAVTFPERPPNYEYPHFNFDDLLDKWVAEQPEKNRTQYWEKKAKEAKAARVKKDLDRPFLVKKTIVFQDLSDKKLFIAWVQWHLKLAQIYDASPGVTKETTDQLKIGIDRDEVEALFGKRGKVVSQNDIGAVRYQTVVWDTVSVQFEQGRATSF
jgi:hypothetical protein